MILRTACLLALLAPAFLFADAPRIERVQIGLPVGPGAADASLTRNGNWAPVAVTLKGSAAGNPQNTYRLRLESTDLEDTTYRTTTAVPAIGPGDVRTVLGYLMPGSDGASFRVQLEDLKGEVIATQAVPSRESNRDVIVGFEDILFLSVGGNLSQLRKDANQAEERPDLDQGKRQVAIVTDVSRLPDRWVGYDAIDVVVLLTGNKAFVDTLTEDTTRCEALAEWVARGGQLVLSVGEKTQEASKLLARLRVLDCQVEPAEKLPQLPVLSRGGWCKQDLVKNVLQDIWVARVTPGPRVDVMVREGRKPLLLSAAHGLGRVVCCAFELDSEAFRRWDGQAAFWERMQAELAPYSATGGLRRGKNAPQAPIFGIGGEQAKFDIQARLKRGLETFPEVPPISFGWVALFILFYILLVGPIDYFILKKVVKRLELTWITFPILVLLVSVAAYVTAYALKGDDVRMNKVDLVEIDLTGTPRAHGHTWFSLFSPRVASYTLGLQPAAGTWTAPPGKDDAEPVVAVLEAGEMSVRTGSQALFRKPYDHAKDLAGLERVPVPVWATRAFHVEWQAPLDANKPIIGITDEIGPLRTARDGRPGLVGRLTNHLPVRLLDICLFYRGQWFTLGTLEPGEQKRVEPLFAADVRGQNREMARWFDADVWKPIDPLAPSGRPIDANFRLHDTAAVLLKPMMFFGAYGQSAATNAGLRRIDQSWRIRPIPEYPLPERGRYRDEVILVARTDRLSDRAETVAEHGASASRLWVGKLPAAGEERPGQRGFMTQETFVRVFIPVKNSP